MHQEPAMTQLTPPDPPGSAARKARGYAADIARLRSQGYTLETIRRALANVGIEVSISTVWRETHRVHPAPALPRAAQASPDKGAPDSLPSPQPDTLPPFTALSGKEFAEAFRRSQSANPFIRAKEKP
jgi:hypothetical protein